MENNFATLFEDVRHKTSLIVLLSITDQGNIKQTECTVYEKNCSKKSCFIKTF